MKKPAEEAPLLAFSFLKINVPLCRYSENSQNGFFNPVGHQVRENGWTLVPP